MKLLAILALLMITVSADKYAVVVSGSSGYDNYRHQADVCHSYQLLLTKGVPAENIIVMSYNDVAGDQENPYPNQLFNKPTTGPGIDVNKGCVIDYDGEDVNPENYIQILTGGTTTGGTGRVLKSGPEDHVFLAFFDHGGPGLIAFPVKFLYADKFLAALQKMYDTKMFAQLTYYMEACESGSMFTNLTTPNIYAVSAASPSESSWGTYCPPNDVVNGVQLNSCLGDLFSVNWMEDSDKENINLETLQKQFQIVKQETDKSHVMQWGDLNFTNEDVSEFQGDNTKNLFLERLVQTGRRQLESASSRSDVDSRDIRLLYLSNKYKKNPTQENLYLLEEEIELNKYFQRKFEEFRKTFNLSGKQGPTTDFDCYRSVIDKFQGGCGKVNNYSLKHFKYLYEVCQYGLDTDYVLSAIDAICKRL